MQLFSVPRHVLIEDVLWRDARIMVERWRGDVTCFDVVITGMVPVTSKTALLELPPPAKQSHRVWKWQDEIPRKVSYDQCHLNLGIGEAAVVINRHAGDLNGGGGVKYEVESSLDLDVKKRGER